MGKFHQPTNGKGSLKAIQILVNECTSWFNAQIRKNIPQIDQIQWVSPVENDGFSEYSDSGFIRALDLEGKVNLSTFWPNGGPHWDALAKADENRYILVEAKAHLKELTSSMKAIFPKSKELIRESFLETKNFLNVEPSTDWEKGYYQYANRLAHLYFLRERCNIDAYLLYVYIVGDTEMNGPGSDSEWKDELENVKNKLGLPNVHPLSPFIRDLFIHRDLIFAHAIKSDE